jgi:hypothetical protein
VYHIEILLLFAALIALGPLVRVPSEQVERSPSGCRNFQVDDDDPDREELTWVQER